MFLFLFFFFLLPFIRYGLWPVKVTIFSQQHNLYSITPPVITKVVVYCVLYDLLLTLLAIGVDVGCALTKGKLMILLLYILSIPVIFVLFSVDYY